MSSITLALALAAGTAEPGADVVTGSVPIWNHVNPTNEYVPTTGVYATETTLSGWVWDQRIFETLYEDRTRHNTFVGATIGNLTEGFDLNWWQTGSLEGLKYLALANRIQRFDRTWTPQVLTGQYTINVDRRPLFSDWSTSSIVDPAQVDTGVVYITLPTDCVYESIRIARYRRTSSADIETDVLFEDVEAFTGEISGTARLDTGTVGAFTPANFALREFEFLVDDANDRAYLNQSGALEVGDAISTAPGLVLMVGTWEDKGCGTGSGRHLYLDHFPVLDGSVEVVNIDSAGTITTYTELVLADADTTDVGFEVDYDLGIVKLTGYKAPNLVLGAAIGVADTEITIYQGEQELLQWPDKGVIVIGSEEIQYFERTSTGFAQCVRGHNGTTAAVHAQYDLVEHRQQGVGTDNSLFVKYTAVPRVEYEVTSSTTRTANAYSWVDVRPFKNVRTHSIFQMLSSEVHLARVDLTVDRPLIGGNLYGPINFGTDVARLTATAYDIYDNPIPDITLTIEIQSGSGTLNGGGTSVSGLTNSLGQIYAYYNVPYSVQEMDLDVISTTHVAADTEMVVTALSPLVDVDDIWVFQILKHDPILGTIGERGVVITSGTDTRFGMLGWVDVDMVLEEEFKDGVIYILGTDAVKTGYNIKDITSSTDGSGLPISRLWLDVPPSAAIVDGQDCWVVQRDAVEWDPGLKRGQKVILYEYSVGYQHPVTGAAGAYGPVHPSSVSGTTLTFTGRNLPIPDVTDDTNPLGAYVVVAPTVVQFGAFGRDPYTGVVVTADPLRLRVEVPQWLTGVDTSGVLPVPHGWKFVTLATNVGGGLGGANFITVNPLATSINQFSLYKSM